MENESGEKIAMAHASIDLQDIGANFNSQTKKFIRPMSSTKSYFDENLAYKHIEELQQWKRQQEDIFLDELKQRSEDHLKNLTEEWQAKRKEQESILAQKLDQCNLLTHALEEGHKALKVIYSWAILFPIPVLIWQVTELVYLQHLFFLSKFVKIISL